MSARGRLALLGAATLAPLLLFPLLVARPLLGISVALAASIAVLAARSPAYPLAFWGVPGIVIGLLGRNPFPNDSVEVFLVGWVVVAILFALLRDDQTLPLRILLAPPVLLSLGLAILMVARLGVSDAPAYGSFKLQLFLAENLTLLVAAILVARRKSDFEIWVGLLLAVTAVSAFVVTHGLLTDPSRFESVGGRFAVYQEATPITLGRATALAVLLGVYLVLAPGPAWRRAFALGAMPVVAIAFVASGSRGPVVGLVAGLVTMLVLTLGDLGTRRRLVLLAAAGVAAALVVPQLVPGQNASRAFAFLVGGDDGSGNSLSNGRLEQWSDAWRAFSEHPLLGVGTGGFAPINRENLYPHNIALEVASELGAVGLVLLVGIVGFTLYALARSWRWARGDDRQRVALVAALFVAALLNASVSGDIAGNSVVWLVAGLTLGLAQRLAPDERLEPWHWAAERLGGRRHDPPEPEAEPVLRSVQRPPAGSGSGSGPAPPRPPAPERREEPPAPRREAEVALDDLPTVLTGAVVLRPRVGGAVRWVELHVARAGTHDWQPLARAEHAPFLLTVDTRRLPDGLYDLRLLAGVEGGSVECSPPLRERPVANLPRTIRVREPAPGSWVRGIVALDARASDGAAVEFQLSADGVSWRTIEEPWDTQEVVDGEYVLRAIGADGRGESEGVRIGVDNTPPRAWLAAPRDGDLLAGPATLAAGAEDAASGVVAVRFELSGEGEAWHEVGVATSLPYEAEVETSAYADGGYLVRCVARDRAGNEGASAPVRLRIENGLAAAAPAREQPARGGPPRPAVGVSETLHADVGRLTLWELETLVAAAGPLREERQALLYALRPYANPDGTIPERFRGLIRDAFGEG